VQTSDDNAYQPNVVITILAVVVASLCWLIVPGLLIFAVPAYERAFADFRVVVPASTEVVIECARWCVKYPYVLPFPLGIIVAGIAVSTGLIRHLLRKPLLGRLWLILMMLLPASVALLIFLVCHLPWMKVLEGIAGRNG
jgi:type II secretory pathway component PulF